MKRILLSTLLISVFVIDSQGATVTWDGGGGDGLWATGANWAGDMAPAPGDNIVLNNSVVTASYTVTLPSGTATVTVSSLTITPSGNNYITLLLPVTNTVAPAFTANGIGDAVVLNNGAIFIDASGAAAGTPVTVTSTNFLRINNGGRYIHRTPRGHTDYLVSRLSTVTGTENGIFEFDIPAASFTISLTGRTYGTLILSSIASGGLITYSGNGGSTLNVNGDLLINAGVTLSLGLSADMIVHGNFMESASSVFNLQNSTNNNIVKIQGDINAAGTITESNSGLPALELMGTTNQNISITGNMVNNVSLRINNAAGATLSAPLTLPYKLELQNGKIKTNATNILTLADNATVTGGSAASFVEGPMKKIGDDNFTFPIGKGSIYAPIAFDSPGLAVTDAFQAEYFRLNPQTAYGINYQAPINHISYVEYWKLDKLIGNANIPARITLTVSQYSFAKDMSTLLVTKYNDADIQWKNNKMNSGIPGVDFPPYVTGTITSNPITPTGIFTIATSDPDAVNPLPIILISFNVIKTGDLKSTINWQLSDYHSDRVKFEVERSVNNNQFTCIKTSYGNISGSSYTMLDDQSIRGLKRYRLKITVEDGKITYSQTVMVCEDSTGFTVNLYPNPVSDKSIIAINSDAAKDLQFIIYDISGKIVKRWQQAIKAGATILPLRQAGIRSGVYFLSVQNGVSKSTIRFVSN